VHQSHSASGPKTAGLFTRAGAAATIALLGLGWTGCSTQTALRYSTEAVAANSPSPEIVPTFEAIRLAKRYVSEHPQTDFMVGSGNSMLPLYKDQTVVVTQRVAVAELRTGMTAVFFGDQGRPVAHVLVRKTPEGWIAMGIGNERPDSTPVTEANLLGIVVKAYEPSLTPLVALLNESASQGRLAAMP
jgi:hypothetical protein